jgi:hypothetical protein
MTSLQVDRLSVMTKLPKPLIIIIFDYHKPGVQMEDLYDYGWRLKLVSPLTVMVYHKTCKNSNIKKPSTHVVGTWAFFDTNFGWLNAVRHESPRFHNELSKHCVISSPPFDDERISSMRLSHGFTRINLPWNQCVCYQWGESKPRVTCLNKERFYDAETNAAHMKGEFFDINNEMKFNKEKEI